MTSFYTFNRIFLFFEKVMIHVQFLKGNIVERQIVKTKSSVPTLVHSVLFERLHSTEGEGGG